MARTEHVNPSDESLTIGTMTADANGVRHYPITSSYQGSTVNDMRILLPSAAVTSLTRFLYVLPVEQGPAGDYRYGDGFDTILSLGVHETYNLIVIAPSFGGGILPPPWYADHPTNPQVRQESYLVNHIIPTVDGLFPPARKRMLLGFSKSGWGAYSLLLRHTNLFIAAAAWDAPLMKSGPDEFEMPAVFGTQDNFERYHISRLLRERAALLRPAPRLGLFGYNSFRSHTVDAHTLLTQLGIPHHYADGPQRRHRWDSGWVQSAVESLEAISGLKAREQE